MQGIILGGFYWGYVITMVPGGMLSEKFGGKYLFGGGIFASSLLALLSPLAAETHWILFLVLRIFQGLAEGLSAPAVVYLSSSWLPAQEKGRLYSIILAGKKSHTK